MSSTNVPPAASEQLCYIHCNFCNIVLAVSVPCNSLFDTVTVRCGNCYNIWPMNVGMNSFNQSVAGSASGLQASSSSHHQQGAIHIVPTNRADLGFASDCNIMRPMTMISRPSADTNAQDINNRPLEKRQRIPSLYNRFIKEEIQRIKASNPHIRHKEAFSTAAKNFEFKVENNQHQANLDENQGLDNPSNDKA